MSQALANAKAVLNELSRRFFAKLQTVQAPSDVDEVGALLKSYSVDRLQGLGRLSQKLARRIGALVSSSKRKGAGKKPLSGDDRQALSKAILLLHACGAFGVAYQGPDAALLRRTFPYLADFAEEVRGGLIDRCANAGVALTQFIEAQGGSVASFEELGDDIGSW